MQYVTHLISIVAVAVAVLTSGCANDQSSRPKLTPVGGKVTLDGKPASDVTVIFAPKSGTPGNGALGTSEADGTFTLKPLGTGDSEELGVPPGDYDVTFSKFLMKDGAAAPWGIQPESVGAVQSLPAVYTNSVESPIDATVTETGGTFDFELSSSAAPKPAANASN